MLARRNQFNRIKRFGSGRKNFFYSKKIYKNPFFGRQRAAALSRGSGLSPRRKLIIIASAAAAIVLIWLIFFSSLFKITEIKVNGVSGSLAAEIESKARALAQNRFIGKNNLLLFSCGELIKILNNDYALQNLSVKRSLPRALKINLREKQISAVWQENDKYYQLDGLGNVIKQADPLNINRQSLPLIENLTGASLNGNKANIDEASLVYIIDLFNEFKEGKHGFEIEKFIVDREARTVKLAALAGPKIFFSTADSAANQAARLDLIVREKLKDSFKSKEYIDLRYGENIYIK